VSLRCSGDVLRDSQHSSIYGVSLKVSTRRKKLEVLFEVRDYDRKFIRFKF
jgi:hypothetical protein